MSTRTHAPDPFTKHPLDAPQYGYIFDEVLPPGVTISSITTPTVSVLSGSSTTALTLTGPAANVAAYDDDDGREVPAGRAVRATTAGGTIGCVYGVEIKITASNGELYAGNWRVNVELPPA
jgi:hypothetical protein